MIVKTLIEKIMKPMNTQMRGPPLMRIPSLTKMIKCLTSPLVIIEVHTSVFVMKMMMTRSMQLKSSMPKLITKASSIMKTVS
jgi:hypothetical protein